MCSLLSDWPYVICGFKFLPEPEDHIHQTDDHRDFDQQINDIVLPDKYKDLETTFK